MADDEIEEYEFEEDRDLPAVQRASSSQLMVAIVFLLVCAVAIYFLLFQKSTSGPDRITKPNDDKVYTSSNPGTAPAPPVQRPRVEPPRFPAPPPPPPERIVRPTAETYNPGADQAEKARLEAEIAAAEAARQRLQERRLSGQLIIDGSSSELGGIPSGLQLGAPAGSSIAPSSFNSSRSNGTSGSNILQDNAGSGGNSQFFDSARTSGPTTVSATKLENLDTVLPQGTIIRGVLETAVNSDLPGLLRAVVSEDTYSFDGSKLLIPKGSRIVGRYNSGVTQGQSRVFVIWQRIIRPDGVSIQVDSPGSDPLGVAGFGGDVDNHWVQRFGSAILLSVIEGALQIGAAEVGNGTGGTAIAIGGASERTGQIADRALQNSISIPPTIRVDQGTRINIFVSQDLDFSATD